MTILVATTAGLTAASIAEVSGPKITISQFRIGTDITTAANPSQTGLVGTTLYTGTTSSFSLYDTTTVQVICEIPANIGPFTFGELAVYMPDGTMFARASYGVPQYKAGVAVDGYAEVFRVHCLIRLEQNTSVFNYYTGTPNGISELPDFRYVVAPSSVANTPVFLVHEPTPDTESVIIYKDNANQWDIERYRKVNIGTVTASGAASLSAALFSTVGDTAVANRFIVQTPAGQIRGITAVTAGVAVPTFDFAPVPSIGSSFTLYEYGAFGLPVTPLMDGTAAVGVSSSVAHADHVHPSDSSYFNGRLATALPLVDATTAVVGTGTKVAREDHVHPTDTSRAALASPALTGVPTAPTAAINTSSTQLATTAFANPGGTVAAYGWTKLPNGLIIQWRNISGTIAGTLLGNFNFPLTFPNAVFSVVGNQPTYGGALASVMRTTIVSTSLFSIGWDNWDSVGLGGTATACIIAIGY